MIDDFASYIDPLPEPGTSLVCGRVSFTFGNCRFADELVRNQEEQVLGDLRVFEVAGLHYCGLRLRRRLRDQELYNRGQDVKSRSGSGLGLQGESRDGTMFYSIVSLCVI